MDPKLSRIGVLLAPSTAVWSGTVSSYNSDTFVLTVSTSGGSLNDVSAGLAVVRTAFDDWARVRAVNVGGGTITLAENPIDYQGADVLAVYAVRLPFPRYQRVTSGGDVYKDFDIVFPGQYASMPPMAHCDPGVIVAALNESVPLDASDSEAMAVGATISSYTWTPGTGGVITGSGATVSVAYSTPGFRYLSLMLTDSQATTHTLYIPCWIGFTPLDDVSDARLTWRDGGGLVADLALITPPTFVQRTPVCVVDLDSSEVLFFGFMHPQKWDYDFERSQLAFTALSTLAYMQELYSYPFLIESVGVGEATEWHEVYSLTLQRAVWFLLYWHSTLPQIGSVAVPAAARAIAGEKFSAGNIQTQMRRVCRAAFWQACGARDGGSIFRTSPLYDSGFGSLPALTLGDDDVRGELQYSVSPAAISEARLAGVFYDGGWEPLIVRAPTHPEDLGRPESITGLAPITAQELRDWTARHLALAKAREYSGRIWVDLDPVDDLRLVLPDAVALGLLNVTYSHDAGRLAWDIAFSGKTRGEDVETSDEPQPPEIVFPPPSPPIALPPIPFLPLPPDVDWPSKLYFATKDGGVFYTVNFGAPLDGTPTWTAVNDYGVSDDLTNYECLFISGDPTAPADHQYLLIQDGDEDNRTVLYRNGTGAWQDWLTNAQAATAIGEANARVMMVAVDETSGDVHVAVLAGSSGDDDIHVVRNQTPGGATWTLLSSVGDTSDSDDFKSFTVYAQYSYMSFENWPRLAYNTGSGWTVYYPIWGPQELTIKLRSTTPVYVFFNRQNDQYSWQPPPSNDYTKLESTGYADAPGGRVDSMWFSLTDSNHIRSVKTGLQGSSPTVIYTTDDLWATTPSSYSPLILVSGIYWGPTGYTDNLVLVRNELDTGETEIIWTWEVGGSPAMVNKGDGQLTWALTGGSAWYRSLFFVDPYLAVEG